jgi:hypothetical protein
LAEIEVTKLKDLEVPKLSRNPLVAAWQLAKFTFWFTVGYIFGRLASPFIAIFALIFVLWIIIIFWWIVFWIFGIKTG